MVAFLNELPKTQHDINSFVVDISAQTVSTYFSLDRSLDLGKGQALRGKEGLGLCWEPRWYLMLLLLFQSTLLCFSVNGVFKEGKYLWSPEFVEWSLSQLVVLSTLNFQAPFSCSLTTTSLSAPKPVLTCLSCLGYGNSLMIRRTQTLEADSSELPSPTLVLCVCEQFT